MTDSTENTAQGGETAGAGSELTIPKHRFDEVSAEVRRLREEVSVKDRLYSEERNRMANQNRQPEPELTPEETGLDPQTHQAVMKIVRKTSDQALAKERAVWNQQIGMLASRTEKAELLASKGADKARYLPKIVAMQQDQWQTTGTFMPAETAYALIRAEENERKVAQLEAQLAGKTPVDVKPAQEDPVAPNPSGTRQIPGGGTTAKPAAKNFRELSVEEMEARLEEQFSTGQAL